MPIDLSVLAAMSGAVEGDPENAGLRLHLAKLLVEAGRPDEALEHCGTVLAKQPDNPQALRQAAESADAAGDRIRAEGYRRLYEAMSMDKAKSLLAGIEDRPFPEPGAAEFSTGASWDDPVFDPSYEHVEDPEFARIRRSYGVGEDSESAFEAERPEVTLADVAGMDEVKRRLNVAFLGPMRNPEMMKHYGKSLRGGLLLYGPPGCGKTYIARAAAGELGAKFLSIGLSDVLDMYVGQSERNLHEIFETARRSRPCVLFFDEIDALGRKRSLIRESAERTVVNQLLSELDSVGGNNEGVFVLAATNHPWDVDTALRRPGRLDRTLLVLPPDSAARKAILHYNLRARPFEGIDLAWLAGQTDGYSGADLAHLCESAAEVAMEDSITNGNTRPIRMPDFKKSLKEIRPSIRPWFDAARNYALFANEGGVYDELLSYLRVNRMM